jgi:hypothetical protein
MARNEYVREKVRGGYNELVTQRAGIAFGVGKRRLFFFHKSENSVQARSSASED